MSRARNEGPTSVFLFGAAAVARPLLPLFRDGGGMRLVGVAIGERAVLATSPSRLPDAAVDEVFEAGGGAEAPAPSPGLLDVCLSTLSHHPRPLFIDATGAEGIEGLGAKASALGVLVLRAPAIAVRERRVLGVR